MATPAWKVSGQYYESCSCDFVCPYVPGQMAVSPSKGSCTFAMAFQVDRGSYGSISLDGLGFIVLGFTPEEMGKGDWSVGLIADERANVEQRDAIATIASGAAGARCPLSRVSSASSWVWNPRRFASIAPGPNGREVVEPGRHGHRRRYGHQSWGHRAAAPRQYGTSSK